MKHEISKEAEEILFEIIAHESKQGYWKNRFDTVQGKDEIILRGCFGELKKAGLIVTHWADNYPSIIQVQKDGYLYEKHNREEVQSAETAQSPIEVELNELLGRTASIKPPINAAAIGTNINEYNRPSEEWVNDAKIFYLRNLSDHPLADQIQTVLSNRNLDTYQKMIGLFNSIKRDRQYFDEKKNVNMMQGNKATNTYDVFISHANRDKEKFVDRLFESIKKLDVKVFYDKDSLKWGDNWKNRILDGVQQSEFAIIVISKNFFDREWTEKELHEFLNRQNANGQKIILPIIHNITFEELRAQYPDIADIQAIDSQQYSPDEIALLFAEQLIKRLRA